MTFSSNAKGYFAAIASAVCYGLNPLGAVSLYKEGFNTDSTLFFRFFFASLLLGIALLLKREDWRLSRRELIYLASLGFMFAMSSLTYYESFRYLDVGVASTLLFIYPIFVALIMAFCFHEKLTIPMMFAILMALAGVFVLYHGVPLKLSTWGVGLILVSSLSYALYLIIVNWANLKCSALKLTFYSSSFCTLVVLLHSFSSSTTHIMLPTTSSSIGYIALLALFPGLLSLIYMAIAVKHIGSTRTAIFGAMEPVTGILVGILAFGESLTSKIFVGICLILSAVTIIVLTGKKGESLDKKVMNQKG